MTFILFDSSSDFLADAISDIVFLLVESTDFNEELCDIIIKYSLFRKLFPFINNLSFHLLCRRSDYLLINISKKRSIKERIRFICKKKRN